MRNYNGVIKATLLRADSAPRGGCSARRRRVWSGPGLPAARSSPLNSNPRALYQHLIPVSICLKMAANAGSMFQYWKRFDLQQLQVSPASTQTGRPLVSSRAAFLSRAAFCADSAAASEVFRKRIQDLFLTLMKVALSLIRNWSSLFNSTSIGHSHWASRATPQGCARMEAQRRSFGDELSVIFIACSLTFTGAGSRS